MEPDLMTMDWHLGIRLSGPLKFRCVMQPAMAIFLACRSGLKDARDGKPPYFWAMLTATHAERLGNAKGRLEVRGKVVHHCNRVGRNLPVDRTALGVSERSRRGRRDPNYRAIPAGPRIHHSDRPPFDKDVARQSALAGRVLKEKKGQTMKIYTAIPILACLVVASAMPLLGQQKGQWVPGQFGLNAGVIPDPGVTYANLALNYSASQLNNSNGSRISGASGNYSFWVDENIFYYVPNHKFLGGYFMPYLTLNYASGEVVANITGANLSSGGGGTGFADMYIQPFNLGWHFGGRVDFNAGYSFTAPTGRYTAGASNNVGSGYWGNNITSGTTFYITKNKGTSANLSTAWEIHGQKNAASIPAGQVSKITPGEAFTMEWGIGQVLPLKKDMSQLVQLGLVGYDQWQVSSNGGNYLVAGMPVPASLVPYYSVHGIGFQANYILPVKAVSAFFKYYDEYSAKARPQGRTMVFGFSWTLRIPKPVVAKN